MSLFEKPDSLADREASRSERLAALFQSQTIPAAAEVRMTLWILVAEVIALGVAGFGGRLLIGEIHPLMWLAAGCIVWTAGFLALPRRPLVLLLYGLGITLTIVQGIVRDPRSFPVTVLVVTVSMVLAFPFSPARMRTPAVVVTCLALLALTPTGGRDLLTTTTFSLTGVAGVVIGYRFLAGLERAVREAQQDRATMLESVERAPMVAMMVDFSGLAAQVTPAPFAELREQLPVDPEVADRLRSGGQVTWLNQAAQDTFGVSNVTADAWSGPDFGASTPMIVGRLMDALARGERYVSLTAEAQTVAGQSRWFSANWVLPEDRPDQCLVVATDVTEIIAARRQLEQHIDDKNRFLGTISHELRTPLTAVLGFSQEALSAAKESGGAAPLDLLELVVEQAEEMSFIIDDLLTAVRTDAGSLAIAARPVDVCDLARRIAVASRKPVQVTAEGEMHVLADPVRVRQILRNLVSNAVRYGGQSRAIAVSHETDLVAVEVRNDGPPVPRDMIESIFQPYVSAHEPLTVTGSMGLGLAVSRQLARLMGGDLVYEREDETTVFRLTLPPVEGD